MPLCGPGNSSVARVLVKGEFQQYVTYEEVKQDDRSKEQTNPNKKRHRIYDLAHLDIAAAFPNSETQEIAKGVGPTDEIKAQECSAVRVFRFVTRREQRVIEIRHGACKWYFFVDGVLVRVSGHDTNVKDKTIIPCQFTVAEYKDEVNTKADLRLGATLNAVAKMKWSGSWSNPKWSYAVTVNGVPIPAMWSKSPEDTQKAPYIPDVLDKAANTMDMERYANGNHEWMRINLHEDVAAEGHLGVTKKSYNENINEKEVKEFYKTTRVWRFTIDEELRGVEVAHQEGMWCILADGVEVQRLLENDKNGRDKKTGRYGCDFFIPLKKLQTEAIANPKCKASMMMQWSYKRFRWDYHLMVNNTYVPQCGYSGNATAPYDFYSIVVPEIKRPQAALMDGGPDAAPGWKDNTIWNNKLQQEADEYSKLFDNKKFDPSNPVPFKMARNFLFTTHMKQRSVVVLHSGGTWRFVIDKRPVKLLDVGFGGYSNDKQAKELSHSSNPFTELKYEARFLLPMPNTTLKELPDTCDGEPALKAILKMSWKPSIGKWDYFLYVNVGPTKDDYADTKGPIEADNKNREDRVTGEGPWTKIAPLYGESQSGEIKEIIDLGDLGLRAHKPTIGLMLQDAEAILTERAREGAKFIWVEGLKYENFKEGSFIKIEGPADMDPQEFRKVKKITPPNKEKVDAYFELDEKLLVAHEIGARIKQTSPPVDPLCSPEDKKTAAMSMEERCRKEIEFITRVKMATHGGEYGIRFVPGLTTLTSESQMVVDYDLVQLLKMYDFFFIKIIGYTAAPSEEDIFKTQDDCKYLAAQRCMEIKSRLVDKGVMNLIGVQAVGYDPDTGHPPCCLIEQSNREEIDELEAKNKQLFEAVEAAAVGKRFSVETDKSHDQIFGSTLSSQASNFTNLSDNIRWTGLTKVMELQSLGKRGTSKDNNVQPEAAQTASGISAYFSNMSNTLVPTLTSLVSGGVQEQTLKGMGLNEATLSDIQMYHIHDEVEYFSRTNKRWIPATVTRVTVDDEVEVLRWTEEGVAWAREVQEKVDKESSAQNKHRLKKYHIFGEPFPGKDDVVKPENKAAIERYGGQLNNSEHFVCEDARCFYDLIFARNRNTRQMVEIDNLRKPLAITNEKNQAQNSTRETLVEVYSKRNGGMWLPGSIDNKVQPAATTLGYDVKVTITGSTEESLPKVPSERLRRRFKKGQEVQFYVNAKEGWKSGTVADEAGDGCAKSEKNHKGVVDFKWLYKSDHQESLLRTVGDTRREEQSFPGPPKTATAVGRVDRIQMAAEAGREDTEQGENAPTDNRRLVSQEAATLGVEPWTLVPIKVEKATVLMELFRLRLPQ